MPRERVPLSELQGVIQVGAPLSFSVFDALGRLLLANGQTIANESQLATLRERGAWIEPAAADQARAAAEAAARGGPTYTTAKRQPTLFDEWEQQVWLLEAQLRALRQGKASAEGLAMLADCFGQLVDRDADVALFMALRPSDARRALYPLLHAVHSAMLVQLAARALGWADDARQASVAAALTMNVAITELQAQMAEQTEPPTSKQMAQIRAHPHAAESLLRAAGVADELWLQAVRQHHERDGGDGYPEGLAAPSAEARLLRIADVYMSKLSQRAFRAALSPQAAARQLLEQERDRKLSLPILKLLGVHPPGCWVRLASGEIGVVARRAVPGGHGLIVATMTDAQGRPTAATQRRDTMVDPAHAVAGLLSDKPPLARVMPERVYGLL